MFRKGFIFIFLLAFAFQAILFHLILLGNIALSRQEAWSEGAAQAQIILQQGKDRNINWLNTNEFKIGNYICDVYKKEQKGDQTRLFFKVDEVEKMFIQKLVEHAKKQNTKKKTGLVFPLKTENLHNYRLVLYDKTTVYPSQYLKDNYNTYLSKTSPPPRA